MNEAAEERRAIYITGMVQGVGFRPFVFRLATRHRLRGFVKNQFGGVCVEAEGSLNSLDMFLADLTASHPSLARIESIRTETLKPNGAHDFQIVASEGELTDEDFLHPDVATCDECLAELFDPLNRRHRYPLITCAHCGPRLTIMRGAPYDRERTTMAQFTLCAQCKAEYENPNDRRFHAETTSCAACGPKLQWLDHQLRPVSMDDPIARAAKELLAGKIGALKGLGGFHLMCDARNEAVVAELRKRKGRDEKPFAVMVANLEEAARWCEVDDDERQLLLSPKRPIVLLRKRARGDGNPLEGVMLPYTPLHHLLMRELKNVPLIMTSGNRNDEPIVCRESRLQAMLGGLADFYLTHNRGIHSRCDDSVARVSNGRRVLYRRSRGYAPAPLHLPVACAVPTMAVGGQMKSVFALGRGSRAIASHHLGELENLDAFEGFTDAIRRYEVLFGFDPKLLAHDLHPDYASTHYALKRAADARIPTIAVQHHHAHIASCMAENGLAKRVIGVAFDGTGYGPDGAIWGGEFLVADYASFERAAHLRYVTMPGSQVAIRQPWRMAVVHALDAGHDPSPFCDASRLANLKAMIERKLNTPRTSSCGRLFDAVAALLGLRRETTFEGQAAMELEWLALQCPGEDPYPFTLENAAPTSIDTRPLISAVIRDSRNGVAKNKIAARFHSTIVDIILKVCAEIRERSDINDVVLSGGVFMNSILMREVPLRLRDRLFAVHQHGEIPANDGGICIGQLAIAASQNPASR